MITMESNKHPKRYLVIPQILLYMILILFFIAATLALLLVIVDDSDLQSKILKAEYVILFIQGISSMIAFVKVVLKNSITVSEWGDIFIHSFKISLLNYISPFRTIRQRYQQVLVSEFNLKRSEGGVIMNVSFSNENLAIWNDLGKREIEKRFLKKSQEEINYIQKSLDQVLISSEKGDYSYNDTKYPFRYASGGSLPIVTIGKTQYYCLIFREIPPVGWNIANGGCDSQDEMLKPSNTIVRELNEELIIFDPELKEWYYFEKFHDLPDHNTVRKHIQKNNRKYPSGFFDDFNKKDALVKFQKGPDKLEVKIKNEFNKEINILEGTERDIFININALDYGIEFDRIAQIKVGKDAIFVDGEPFPYSKRYPMVNAPIGLFEKSDLDNSVRRGNEIYIPDFFFWDAQRYPSNLVINDKGISTVPIHKDEIKKDLNNCIDNFIIPKKLYMPNSLKEFYRLRNEDEDKIYNLCPVTCSIIKRL